MTLSPERAGELRRIAEAATTTGLRWRLSRTRRCVMDGIAAPWIAEVTKRSGWEANAAHIAAFDPPTVLALLSDHAALATALDEAREWSRLRAEDIMALGNRVAELEGALRRIADESALTSRAAEDTDTDYFLRCIKASKELARAFLLTQRQT